MIQGCFKRYGGPGEYDNVCAMRGPRVGYPYDHHHELCMLPRSVGSNGDDLESSF